MSDNNYFNTFIAVADDCAAAEAKVPQPRGGKKTVAVLQYEMLHDRPYQFTQEQVLFDVWLARQDLGELAEDEVAVLREQFLAKPQPCLRTSPLTKSHGWGIAFDEQGRAALCPRESSDYAAFVERADLTVVKALRSSKA